MECLTQQLAFLEHSRDPEEARDVLITLEGYKRNGCISYDTYKVLRNRVIELGNLEKK